MASRSTKFYQKNKKSRDAKNAYNRKFYKQHKEALNASRAERKKYRENNNLKDNEDAAHKGGKIVTKSRRLNRGSKSDSPGDRRARGGKARR